MNCLRVVLIKIKTVGIVQSPSKCIFGARRIEYLCYVIEAGQVRIKEEWVEQIWKLKRPTTVMELRKALGASAEMDSGDGRNSKNSCMEL